MATKIVINKCYGGFSLSDKAYERLIELGIPVRPYIPQQRGPDGLYKREERNDGEVIFDRSLTPDQDFCDAEHIRVMGRFWETFLRQDRTNPLLVQVVQELGEAAEGRLSQLVVIEISDGIEWEINDYDGIETIHEKYRVLG